MLPTFHSFKTDARDEAMLSVVVPTHGRTELFRQTLASLEHQTLAAFEVIVTDDSTDWNDRSLIQEAAMTYSARGRRWLR